MDKITIPVKELLERVKEMDKDGMDFAELSILEPDAAENLPACLWLTGLKKSEPYESVDYDSIDAIDNLGICDIF